MLFKVYPGAGLRCKAEMILEIGYDIFFWPSEKRSRRSSKGGRILILIILGGNGILSIQLPSIWIGKRTLC